MLRRSTAIAVGLVALLLCTGLFVQRQSASSRAKGDAAQVAAHTVGPEATPDRAPRALSHGNATQVPVRQVAARIVLPPADAPLAPVLPTLVQAARRGDVGAMCRLAYELKRCRDDLENARRAVESVTESMGEPETSLIRVDGKWVAPDRSALLARHTAKRDQLEAVCAGVSPQTGLEPWRLELAAARAGHVPSIVRFAAGQPLRSYVRLTDIEGLRAYRDEAPDLLRRAAAMGDPQAAFVLMHAYRGNGTVAATGRIPEDPGLALAYALALLGVGDAATERSLVETIAKLRRTLDAPQQRAAELAALHLALRFSGVRGSSLDLRTQFGNRDGSECNQPEQPEAYARAVEVDAPIAPVRE